MKQVVNMRASYAQLAGDEAGQLAYEHEVESARAAMVAPLQVAPRMTVRTRHGVLGPGAEVRLEDVEGYDAAHGYVPGHEVLRQLVNRGVVIEAHELPAPPPRGT
jgi:hypothetical protein